MNVEPSRSVLRRLRTIDWSDEDAAWRHENSRALLMREYLRRAALWADHCGAERSWPFFDLAEHVDAAARIPDGIAAELDEVLRGVGPSSVRTTCRAAVRWAVLRTGSPAGPLPDLPDPYEPLLALYERGGGFFVEEFIDLGGAMVRFGTVESNLAARPFLTLAPATLDALDAEGEITYYAKIDGNRPRSSPRGVVRRRVDEGRTYDEAFTRDLRWEPTEYLRLYALGHNDIDHVEITETEAAAFIESLSAGPPVPGPWNGTR
ncbi:hypothetical protein [Streptomyces sp. sk2.1]|uniref:hypothetical protein n=1 Tax=Streptomyces sp. sk2.1 TaxID=2478959 RepID=UPI0011E86CBC|nr:hypothetical protein [Streptomyces sp. sk2.1]TXS75902.1 hypothetical protein EAO76_11875 [Streptomyces sp. sk2.1]